MPMRYHMRRMNKAITDEEEMRSILKSTQYVTIAMARAQRTWGTHSFKECKQCSKGLD